MLYIHGIYLWRNVCVIHFIKNTCYVNMKGKEKKHVYFPITTGIMNIN